MHVGEADLRCAVGQACMLGRATLSYPTAYCCPIAGKFVSWYRPATLAQVLELRTRFPSAKMVVGNTEVCVLCIVC